MHRNFSFWFLKPQTKQNKQKSYQARETSCFGFHDSYLFNNTDISISDRREEKYNDKCFST